MIEFVGVVKRIKLQLDNYEPSFDFYFVALVGFDGVMGA